MLLLGQLKHKHHTKALLVQDLKSYNSYITKQGQVILTLTRHTQSTGNVPFRGGLVGRLCAGWAGELREHLQKGEGRAQHPKRKENHDQPGWGWEGLPGADRPLCYLLHSCGLEMIYNVLHASNKTDPWSYCWEDRTVPFGLISAKELISELRQRADHFLSTFFLLVDTQNTKYKMLAPGYPYNPKITLIGNGKLSHPHENRGKRAQILYILYKGPWTTNIGDIIYLQ